MTFSDKKALKALSELNLMPFSLMLLWIVFVVAVYANPSVPSIELSAGFMGGFRFFEPYDRFMLICGALRIIALIFVFFQLTSLILGFIAAKTGRCIGAWRTLCIVNIVLCLISTNVISAGVTRIIFARLSGVKGTSYR